MNGKSVMTDRGDSKAAAAVDVSLYRDGPLALVDDDGEVRVYAYDEKLRRPVVDEERTRSLDPEFVEHLKWLDEYRKIHGGGTDGGADAFGCQNDRGHAPGL